MTDQLVQLDTEYVPQWKTLTLGVLRVCIGIAFLQSSVSKLELPYDTLSSVYSYHLLGSNSGYIVAFMLPWTELACACSLFTGVLLRGGLLTSVVLHAIFLGAKISAVHRRLEIGCGCRLTSVGEVVGIQDVILSVTFLFLSLVAFGLTIRNRRLKPNHN